jgi:hypothetical protein
MKFIRLTMLVLFSEILYEYRTFKLWKTQLITPKIVNYLFLHIYAYDMSNNDLLHDEDQRNGRNWTFLLPNHMAERNFKSAKKMEILLTRKPGSHSGEK